MKKGQVPPWGDFINIQLVISWHLPSRYRQKFIRRSQDGKRIAGALTTLLMSQA